MKTYVSCPLLSISFCGIEADSAENNVGSDLLSSCTTSLQQKDSTDLLSVNCGKLRAFFRQYCVTWCFVCRLTTLLNARCAAGPLDSICLKARSNFELRSDADTRSISSRRRRGRHGILFLADCRENLVCEGEDDTFSRFEGAFVGVLWVDDPGCDVDLLSWDVMTMILYFTSRST